jgi:NADPH:quinone reductase-like Zn-dependent oxidoreductase
LGTSDAFSLAQRDPKHAAFQLYAVTNEITTAPIPDSLPFEQAVVLPLSISTAAAGLYQKGYLELPYPTTDVTPSGKTILVWGGSSSVGSSTIQLAVASGLEVVSTSSAANIEYVKALGAKHVFDHSDLKVVDEVVAVLKGTDFVGAYDAISLPDTLQSTSQVVHKLGGGKLATVLVPSDSLPSDVTVLRGTSYTSPSLYLALHSLTSSSSGSTRYSNRSTASWRSHMGKVYSGGVGQWPVPGET